jgi:hypothetical protein
MLALYDKLLSIVQKHMGGSIDDDSNFRTYISRNQFIDPAYILDHMSYNWCKYCFMSHMPMDWIYTNIYEKEQCKFNTVPCLKCMNEGPLSMIYLNPNLRNEDLVRFQPMLYAHITNYAAVWRTRNHISNSEFYPLEFEDLMIPNQVSTLLQSTEFYGDPLYQFWRIDDEYFMYIVQGILLETSYKRKIVRNFAFPRVSYDLYIKYQHLINYGSYELLVFKYNAMQILSLFRKHGDEKTFRECLSASETITLRTKMQFIMYLVDDHEELYYGGAKKVNPSKHKNITRRLIRQHFCIEILSRYASYEDIIEFATDFKWDSINMMRNMNLSAEHMDDIYNRHIVDRNPFKIPVSHMCTMTKLKNPTSYLSGFPILHNNVIKALEDCCEKSTYNSIIDEFLANSFTKSPLYIMYHKRARLRQMRRLHCAIMLSKRAAKNDIVRTKLWLIYEVAARGLVEMNAQSIAANFARLIK